MSWLKSTRLSSQLTLEQDNFGPEDGKWYENEDQKPKN